MKLKIALILIVTIGFPLSVTASPNILLVIADDMGLDASRCYDVGDQQANMPTLESLCMQGRVYDNAYAAPTCSPTRATVMTGLYGFRTGIGGAISKKGKSNGLSVDALSLFDVLADSNYQSAVIGKWHLAGGDSGLDHPAELGVSEYFGLYNGGVKDYSNWQGVHNGETVNVSEYATTALTDKAIEWTSAQNDPWFLWLAYNAPHAPFHLPPQDLHTAGNLPTDKNSIDANRLSYYNAMLEAMDSELGRLLSSMTESVRNNTVILFVGDNGTPSSIARPVYGGQRAKGSIYQGGTNVPLIISGKGVVAGRSDALVNSTDLFATISSIAGVPATTVDAKDISITFTGAAGNRSFVYVEHFGSNKRRPDTFGWALRNDRYKLVAVEDAGYEMYDLQRDPFEQSNIFEKAKTDVILGKQLSSLEAVYQKIHEN